MQLYLVLYQVGLNRLELILICLRLICFKFKNQCWWGAFSRNIKKGIMVSSDKGFIISILFRRVMYFRMWCIRNQAKRFKQRTGELGSTQLSELRSGEFSSRSWSFYEIKFSNYIRARCAHNVVPILWIKLEYDLILPSHSHSYVTFSILLIYGLKEYGSVFHIDWKYIFLFHICLMYFVILCRVSKIGNLWPN